ncbi:MAG: hypothetical protein R3Y46_01960 [Opitutales bacterium]
MQHPKINTPIYAIDFEGSKAIGILEFAIIEIVDWKITSIETHLCKPKGKVDKKTLAFCHLNEELLKDKVAFEGHINTFLQARRKGLFLAHNKATEDSLLRLYFPNPEVFSDFSNNSKCLSWSPWIDTYRLCKKIFPKLKSYNLSELISAFNLTEELKALAKTHCPSDRAKWHCAPYDTIAAALLLIKIATLDGFENLDLAWLCELSGNKKELSLD